MVKNQVCRWQVSCSRLDRQGGRIVCFVWCHNCLSHFFVFYLCGFVLDVFLCLERYFLLHHFSFLRWLFNRLNRSLFIHQLDWELRWLLLGLLIGVCLRLDYSCLGKSLNMNTQLNWLRHVHVRLCACHHVKDGELRSIGCLKSGRLFVLSIVRLIWFLNGHRWNWASAAVSA